jgi:plastocyanin
MNMRRLSYGLLATFAAAMMVACGDSTPAAEAPPQPTASPADSAAAAASQTAAAEPPPAPTQTAEPTPPPPPPTPAAKKLTGKFAQDFSGDVADAANTAAQKAGGAKKDQKKIDAALDKAKKAFSDQNSTIEVAGDTLTWSLKGKAAHTVKIDVPKSDDANSVTIKLLKDGKTDLKGKDLAISFSDDDTFSFTDPFAKKDGKKLVFKRQK